MLRGLRAVFGALFSGAGVESTVPETAALPYDTMLLGRALFLNSSLLQPPTAVPGNEASAGQSEERVSGGRTHVPLIWSVGPGRIFLKVPGES